MKKLTAHSLIIALVAFSIIGLATPTTVFAATAPNLGIASSYAIWGKAGVANTGAPTHIWGNVGADLLSNITGLTAGQVDGTMAGPVPGLQTAITAAYGELNLQGADGGQTLSGTVVITPGVWTVGAALLNGTVTLNGAGVYIFRSSSNITVSPGAQVILTNGATACNVFWQVPDAMTIGVGAHVEGTIITDTSLISLDTNASLVGRALSSIGQVTLDNNLITNPCAAASTPAPGALRTGTINVVKTVINDNGGTKTVGDFSLFVNNTSVISGATNTFAAPADAYLVTETGSAGYLRTFSGDCDLGGYVSLTPGQNKFCIVTNNDIGAPVAVPPVPPLIDLLKTASPLALSTGPGTVVYTYTLRNVGTVPVTNVTIVGDTCSPIIRASGDTNGDNRLDLNETWIHTCNQQLSVTHTNTAVATGWANGISAVDIASATVVVGVPIIPPLIHVTKVPSRFTLPAAGGAVTYRYTVTNPGTAPLSNVSITDDKCTGLPGRVVGHPGDLNKNDLLERNEAWQFTCQTNLSATTINIGTAQGSANGFTARDFAIATVVVAAGPLLPSAGLAPVESNASWNSIALSALVFLGVSLGVVLRRRTA